MMAIEKKLDGESAFSREFSWYLSQMDFSVAH